MGLMDKFKNLFTDEEIIEDDDADAIQIREVKKEEEVHKLPTFMREKIEKEEQEQHKQQEDISSELEIKRDLKLENKIDDYEKDISKNEESNTFKFPIDFTDNDFIETRSRQSLHQQRVVDVPVPKKEIVVKEKSIKSEPKVSDLYKDKKKEKEESRRFQATPIISPIYGVLDKNYTPGDVENTKGNNLEEHRHSKNVDFDSVRKKAYGNLNEEIKENLMCENCEYLKEAKACKKKEKITEEENLVYDVLAGDSDDNMDDITLDEATENYYDYGVEYEKRTKRVPEGEEVKIVNHEEEHTVHEIPPVKSSINLLSTLKKSMGDEVPKKEEHEKNLELTDDLFNLIDSMYDERNGS